jgi:hypothetical protein
MENKSIENYIKKVFLENEYVVVYIKNIALTNLLYIQQKTKDVWN